MRVWSLLLCAWVLGVPVSGHVSVERASETKPATRLTAIEVSLERRGLVISLAGDGVLTPSSIHELEQWPPGVVVELSGVLAAVPPHTPIQVGPLEGVRVETDHDEALVTRVVVDLTTPTLYRIESAEAADRALRLVFPVPGTPRAAFEALIEPASDGPPVTWVPARSLTASMAPAHSRASAAMRPDPRPVLLANIVNLGDASVDGWGVRGADGWTPNPDWRWTERVELVAGMPSAGTQLDRELLPVQHRHALADVSPAATLQADEPDEVLAGLLAQIWTGLRFPEVELSHGLPSPFGRALLRERLPGRLARLEDRNALAPATRVVTTVAPLAFTRLWNEQLLTEAVGLTLGLDGAIGRVLGRERLVAGPNGLRVDARVTTAAVPRRIEHDDLTRVWNRLLVTETVGLTLGLDEAIGRVLGRERLVAGPNGLRVDARVTTAAVPRRIEHDDLTRVWNRLLVTETVGLTRGLEKTIGRALGRERLVARPNGLRVDARVTTAAVPRRIERDDLTRVWNQHWLGDRIVVTRGLRQPVGRWLGLEPVPSAGPPIAFAGALSPVLAGPITAPEILGRIRRGLQLVPLALAHGIDAPLGVALGPERLVANRSAISTRIPPGTPRNGVPLAAVRADLAARRLAFIEQHAGPIVLLHGIAPFGIPLAPETPPFETKEISETGRLSRIITTRPAVVAQTQTRQPGQPQEYTGEPVSMDFQNADLRAVLRTFAEISGLNIVIDPRVDGVVDVSLTDVPWDQALDIILRANQLGYDVDGTVVRIAPLVVLADEEAQRRKLAEEQALSGELVVLTRTLSYARAEDMTALVTPLLSVRGQVQIDERTNTMILTDLRERLGAAEQLLDTLDRPEPQVEIEARIVQATKDFTREIGVQWGLTGRVAPDLGNTTPLTFPNRGGVSGRLGTQGANASGADVRAQDTENSGTAVNLGAANPTSALGVSLGAVDGALNLDVVLSAAEGDGQVSTLSHPRVTTQNNVQAEIVQGDQIPIQVVANNTVTVTFQDAALSLRVTPQITAANTVIMQIEIDNDFADFGRAVGGIPPIVTQRASTTVQVADGDTTVIGGIFESQQASRSNRVPALHRIPLLGWMFRSHSEIEDQSELLIFLTPRIVR